MKKIYSLISILAVSFAANFAFAADFEPKAEDTGLTVWQTIGEIIQEHDNVITDFSDVAFNDQTQKALNSMIEYAARSYEFYGYPADADQIRKEWEGQFSSHFTGIGIMDLGDHRALSQWLTDQYKKLRLRFGDMLVARLHLDDINIINYAIPVVFHPVVDKKSGETWDKLEYSKHFVPFASVVTYWASYGTCYFLTKKLPQVRKYCKNISGLLRTGMTNWAAPRLSDWVYDTAHKVANRRGLEIDRMTIRAKYEQEIRSWGIQ